MNDKMKKEGRISLKNRKMHGPIEESARVKESLRRMNLNIWRAVSMDIVPFSLFLCIYSYVVPSLKSSFIFALVAFISSVVNIVVYMPMFKKGIYKSAYVACFYVLWIGLSITDSCLNRPDQPSVLILIVLLSFAAVQIINPIANMIISFSAVVISSVMIWVFKSPEIRNINMMIVILGGIYCFRFGMNVLMSKNISMSKAMGTIDKLYKDEIENARRISALASLSSEYRTILYADIKTERITDVYASGINNFTDGIIGVSFLDALRKYCDDFVYVEDSEMVKSTLTLENVRKAISEGNALSARYRILENNSPVYYEIKIINALKTQTHEIMKQEPIIIAVKNVDIEVRLDMVFRANFEEIEKKATKDIMTGVKNKTAYEEKYQELQQQIEYEDKLEFAIVMCDVNGLKHINDTKGHEAGDQLIKDVCHIVSTVYTHSPVYRIGGDEFVVILQESDYQNRDLLEKEIKQQAVSNPQNVSFAVGMSIFDRKSDTNVSDVFNRADNAMYQNKVEMKGTREDTAR